MVTVALPPTVEYVLVRGSAWSEALLTYLDAEGMGHPDVAHLGYAMPVGESQFDTLPWTNIDTISIVFSDDVSVEQDDLALWGVNVVNYVTEVGFAADGFTYDSATFTATWTLAQSIAADKLLIDLDGDAGGVANASGNVLLDGEWQDGVSTVSGDGVPGGDFRFRLNILPGDADQNGEVGQNDLSTVQAALGTAPGVTGYSPLVDVNGDGTIITTDLLFVNTHLGVMLPSGSPMVPPLLPGDANRDGRVDDSDASILGAHWHQQVGATWAMGDFNGDGKVNDMDAAIVAAHWGERIEPLLPGDANRGWRC